MKPGKVELNKASPMPNFDKLHNKWQSRLDSGIKKGREQLRNRTSTYGVNISPDLARPVKKALPVPTAKRSALPPKCPGRQSTKIPLKNASKSSSSSALASSNEEFAADPQALNSIMNETGIDGYSTGGNLVGRRSTLTRGRSSAVSARPTQPDFGMRRSSLYAPRNSHNVFAQAREARKRESGASFSRSSMLTSPTPSRLSVSQVPSTQKLSARRIPASKKGSLARNILSSASPCLQPPKTHTDVRISAAKPPPMSPFTVPQAQTPSCLKQVSAFAVDSGNDASFQKFAVAVPTPGKHVSFSVNTSPVSTLSTSRKESPKQVLVEANSVSMPCQPHQNEFKSTPVSAQNYNRSSHRDSIERGPKNSFKENLPSSFESGNFLLLPPPVQFTSPVVSPKLAEDVFSGLNIHTNTANTDEKDMPACSLVTCTASAPPLVVLNTTDSSNESLKTQQVKEQAPSTPLCFNKNSTLPLASEAKPSSALRLSSKLNDHPVLEPKTSFRVSKERRIAEIYAELSKIHSDKMALLEKEEQLKHELESLQTPVKEPPTNKERSYNLSASRSSGKGDFMQKLNDTFPDCKQPQNKTPECSFVSVEKPVFDLKNNADFTQNRSFKNDNKDATGTPLLGYEPSMNSSLKQTLSKRESPLGAPADVVKTSATLLPETADLSEVSDTACKEPSTAGGSQLCVSVQRHSPPNENRLLINNADYYPFSNVAEQHQHIFATTSAAKNPTLKVEYAVPALSAMENKLNVVQSVSDSTLSDTCLDEANFSVFSSPGANKGVKTGANKGKFSWRRSTTWDPKRDRRSIAFRPSNLTSMLEEEARDFDTVDKIDKENAGSPSPVKMAWQDSPSMLGKSTSAHSFDQDLRRDVISRYQQIIS